MPTATTPAPSALGQQMERAGEISLALIQAQYSEGFDEVIGIPRTQWISRVSRKAKLSPEIVAQFLHDVIIPANKNVQGGRRKAFSDEVRSFHRQISIKIVCADYPFDLGDPQSLFIQTERLSGELIGISGEEIRAMVYRYVLECRSGQIREINQHLSKN